MAGEESRDIITGLPEHFKPSLKRTNHLFCIGINDYAHVSKLNNAVKDVEDFAALMEKEYNFKKEHIHILKNKQATKERIIDELEEYARKLKKEDNFLLYFSGHGVKHQLTERGYWIPVKGKKEKASSWLPNDEVMSFIRPMKAHHIFLIIDSCFSGTFFTPTRSHSSKYDKEPSRYAITSGAEEIVPDGPEGHNSPFAQSLLTYLEGQQEPAIGAGKLFEEIKKRISGNQKPQGNRLNTGKLFPGEFIFYRRENPEQKEERAYQQAIKLDTEKAWDAFIEECERGVYPGKYLEVAEEQLRLVGEKRKWERIKEFPSLYDLRRFIRNNSVSPFLGEAERLYEKLKNNPEELEIDFVKTFEDALKDETNSNSPPKVNPTSKELNGHPFLKTLGLEMVKVEGGSFMMGGEGEYDGKPIHQVSLKDFHIGKYPVTQAQWEKVMGENPSHFKGDLQRPVEMVSWGDCHQFIKKLNQQTGRKFRLPSEAEWEFAARGGKLSKGFIYAGSDQPEEVGWLWRTPEDGKDSVRLFLDKFLGISGKTHSVGQKDPNELGLYDMSGNVWEWCADDWHDNYKKAPDNSSAWIDQPRAETRVVRGGSWFVNDDGCSVAFRLNYRPSYLKSDIGFRLSGYSAP
ncbi:MAG: SUMF1/EgtB/PvdO family nonheme iron enzyme [Bacteroidota bacterium]